MNKLFAIVVFVGLAACNQKKDQEQREPLQPATAPAPPPAASGGSAPTAGSAPAPAPTMAPAGGSAAGSAAAAGGATTPTPVACATASALHCDAGQVDGCTGGLTSVHLCVAGDAKPGAPCAQGAALTCPSGQVDACTYTPPYASNHICAVVPKPAP